MVDLNSLNPQQRQAAETINGPVLILAGAGTGKTRVITFRIAHMIARGIAPDNILAVTFTNKAAREMQQRASKLIPRTRTNPDEKPPRPTICTFHSLCVRILRQHIEKLGYKRNFVIYDDRDSERLIKECLAALRIPNFLQNLFGEGVLSASFIPVYARLLADPDAAVRTNSSCSSMVDRIPTNAMLSEKPSARPVRHFSTSRRTAAGSKSPASSRRRLVGCAIWLSRSPS